MRWLYIILIVVVTMAVGGYAYMGGFRSVVVTQEEFGPVEFAYAPHRGSYANLSKTWGAFMPKWTAAKLKTCDAMGVYLDPPGTPDENLRSLIGCRIDAWSEADKAQVRATFRTLTIPASPALTARFPFRNFLSFFFAPARVYPEIEKKIAELKSQRSIGVELYGPFDNIVEITFVVPLTDDLTPYRLLYDAVPVQ